MSKHMSKTYTRANAQTHCTVFWSAENQRTDNLSAQIHAHAEVRGQKSLSRHVQVSRCIWSQHLLTCTGTKRLEGLGGQLQLPRLAEFRIEKRPFSERKSFRGGFLPGPLLLFRNTAGIRCVGEHSDKTKYTDTLDFLRWRLLSLLTGGSIKAPFSTRIWKLERQTADRRIQLGCCVHKETAIFRVIQFRHNIII